MALDDLYADKILASLNLNSLIDEIYGQFFVDDNPEDLATSIHLIREKFQKHKVEIKALTQQSSVSSGDCLAKSIIAIGILKHFGFSAKVAHDKRFHRNFHSFLVDNASRKVFKVAGKSKINSFKVMGAPQVIRRSKVTNTIVTVLGKVRNLIKT